MPPAITPRPRPRKRIDRDLASFLDPGPAASFLRTDSRTWREAVAEIFETLRNPDSRPEAIRAAVAELSILAGAADEVATEVRRELNTDQGRSTNG